MKKKTKIINTALGATVLGGGFVIGAIAQSCQTPAPNEPNTEAITAIRTAIRSLATYNGNGTIPEDTNEAALYNVLQVGVRALTNVPITAQITSINITDSGNVIVSGTTLYNITIAVGTFELQANNIPNGATTISNPVSAVTISNITFENGIINTSGSSVFGLVLIDPAIAVIQTAIEGLSSYNDSTGANPSNANEAQLFTALLRGVRNLAGASVNSLITAISINNPSSSISVVEAVNGSYTLTITQGTTNITATQLSNNDTTIANNTLPLIISNITFSNNIISTTNSVVSGLTSLNENETIVINTLLGLASYNSTTFNPTTNQQEFLTSLNTVSGEGNVQSIRFSANVTATTQSDNTITVSIGSGTTSDNAFVVVYPNTGRDTTNGIPSVWSNANDGALTITGITVDLGVITIPTTINNYGNTYTVDADATIGLDAVYGLRAANAAPDSTTFPNQLMIWNQIQQQIQITLGTVVTLNSIAITTGNNGEIGDSIIIVRGGAEIILNTGGLQILYTPAGQEMQTFTNSVSSFSIGVVYTSNAITTVTIPSDFVTLTRGELTRSLTSTFVGTRPIQSVPAIVNTLFTLLLAKITSDVAGTAVTVTSGQINGNIIITDTGGNVFTALIPANNFTLVGTNNGSNVTFTNTVSQVIILFTYSDSTSINVMTVIFNSATNFTVS